MLEIRKGSASKSFENTFFRDFAHNLSKMFDHYNYDGLLLGNSVCEERLDLQIDALLICKNQIIIIDFKNYDGTITLPGQAKNEFEFVPWQIGNGNIVSSGHESNRNPFMQVSKQKDKFCKIIEKNINPELPIGDSINLKHIRTAICFQGKVELKREIPKILEKFFFIFDKDSYLNKIRDIIDTNERDISLSPLSFDIIKKTFQAEEYKINEDYSNYFENRELLQDLNFDNLYQDQKIALQEVEKFIRNDEENIFILQGTSYSGKTHLIPFIKELAFNNSKQEVILLANSARVANNLLKESHLEFQSIYQYIYGGKSEFQSDDSKHDDDEINESIDLEIVPLKENSDAEDAIYIVDEAQLISNSFNQSFDTRFGTGYLLSDFLNFTDFHNKKRKIIFLGDCFQISSDKDNENSLNPDYYTKHFELQSSVFQLEDKENKSEIVDEALKLVSSIRKNIFNNLQINSSPKIQKLHDEEILGKISEGISSGINTHILCYSKTDAQKINLWIKNKILKNGSDLANEDLLLINNNVKTQKDVFSDPKKLFNGQFAKLISFGEPFEVKGIKAPLKYREVFLELIDSGQVVNMLSLENYRNEPKGELSKEETISINIFLNELAKKEVENFKIGKYESDKELRDLFESQKKGKRVKGKIYKKVRKLLNNYPNTEYFKYKNAVFLKFGWALTVHKARSYNWNEVFFNVETGGGKFNESYFKWYYTGLTRAKHKINLIKYNSINCFSKIEVSIVENLKESKKVYFFIADKTVDLKAENLDILSKYHFPENNSVSDLLQLYHLINGKLKSNNLHLLGITHNNYQEVYEIKNSAGNFCKISFSFNNNGQIGFPKLMNSNNSKFGEDVMSFLNSNSYLTDFKFIKDDWRRQSYIKLIDLIKLKDIHCSYIIQNPYKDTVLFVNDKNNALVEFNYDGQGFFTIIKPTYYDSSEFWEEIKNSINIIKSSYELYI